MWVGDGPLVIQPPLQCYISWLKFLFSVGRLHPCTRAVPASHGEDVGNGTARHTEHWSSVHHGQQVVLPHPGVPHARGDAATANPRLCAWHPGQWRSPLWFLLSHEDLEAEHYLPVQLGHSRLPSDDMPALSDRLLPQTEAMGI